MASMADPQDRCRVLEKLNDSVAEFQGRHQMPLTSGQGPAVVVTAWDEFRTAVLEELEAARLALAA